MAGYKTNKGFVVVGNTLVASVLFLLVGVFGFNLFGDNQTATALSMETESDSFYIDEPIVVKLYVKTRIPFNALDVSINFPADSMEIGEIEFEDSVINLWVTKPTFSNEAGVVRLTGGISSKVDNVGKIYVATIKINPTKHGSLKVDVSSSIAFANSIEDNVNANFIVKRLNGENETNVVKKEQTVVYFINEKKPSTVDLNNDGEISIADLSAFLSDFTGEYVEKNDFNDDGEINIKDISIIMSSVIKQ